MYGALKIFAFASTLLSPKWQSRIYTVMNLVVSPPLHATVIISGSLEEAEKLMAAIIVKHYKQIETQDEQSQAHIDALIALLPVLENVKVIGGCELLHQNVQERILELQTASAKDEVVHAIHAFLVAEEVPMEVAQTVVSAITHALKNANIKDNIAVRESMRVALPALLHWSATKVQSSSKADWEKSIEPIVLSCGSLAKDLLNTQVFHRVARQLKLFTPPLLSRLLTEEA